jgi:alpha-glucosidase
VHLPDDARQDPTWFRTDGERYGRDGCRVPIPWEADAPGYGFSPTGASWLPQPEEWHGLARSVQDGDPASTLTLYRELLAARRRHDLGTGSLEWVDLQLGDDVVAFRNGDVLVVANTGTDAVALPAGEILVSSVAGLAERAEGGSELPVDAAVWIRAS